MSVSIVILKSGEKLITDLKEAFETIEAEETNQKGICLIFKRPYELSLNEVDSESNLDLQVGFSRWCPFAIDTEFKIPYDAVLAIATPDSTLAEAYSKKIAMIEELETKTSSNFELQQQELQFALEEIKQNPPEKNE